jgi:tetratricopeptide (TPR) repeat protein
VAQLRDLGAEKGLAALTAAPHEALAPLVGAVGHSPKLIELVVGLGNWDRRREVAGRLPRNLRLAQDALLADAFERLRATPGALELVQQVGVFVPSADFAALRAVAENNLPKEKGADFDDALAAACATALLSRAPDPGGTLRYRLHPLVARYLDATDALRPPDDLLAAARRAHAAYFAEFAAPRWDMKKDENRAALDGEWENLQAGWREAEALHQAALAAGDAGGAREAAGWVKDYAMGLRDFVNLRGFWTEGRALLEAGVAAARQVGDKALEELLMCDQARLFRYLGNPQQARRLYEQSLNIRQKPKDTSNKARALHELARLDSQEGNGAAARARYEESLAIKRRIGDVQGEAATLHALARLDAQAGHRATARARYEKSLAIKRHIGDVQGEAATLHQLANLDVQAGDIVAARSRYEQSLVLERRIGDVQGEARTLRNLGHLDRTVGDRSKARHLYEQSLDLFRRCGDVEGEASVQRTLGTLLCEEEAWTEGLAMLRAAVATYTQLEMPRELGRVRKELARYERKTPPGVRDTGG